VIGHREKSLTDVRVRLARGVFMDGSKSDGKKIVFTKRKKTASTEEAELQDLSPEVPASTEGTQEEDTKHFYEGEIFDQFYRPLGLTGGVQRLRELAKEALTPPSPAPRLSNAAREFQAAERQAIAEALAHQMYKCAQQVRETDIDVYLSAFNVALAGRPCREAQDILARMNEFFTAHYYTAIRERGERPEVYQQILKRVGHQHSERLSKIVFGLDVEEVAKKAWNLYHGAYPDKSHRIEDILLDVTEFQLLALREEFCLLPYKDLARQIHGVLHQSAAEGQGTARKTIGKSEVYEHKKQAAFRARDQLRAIRYLILGRSVEEMELVKRFYIELGDQSLPDAELTLEADLRRSFSPADIERMGRLISGWTAHYEAEEIHSILFARSRKGRPEDFLSDPKDSVDRDHTQGLGPYLQRFKKHRIIHHATSLNEQIFNVYEILRERIAALTPSRFFLTNQALREYYGYEIDPTLFPSLIHFDARQTAVMMHERLECSFDIFEAMQPMEYLEPKRCLAVQKAFECLYGKTLRSVVESRARVIATTMSAGALGIVLDRYLEGHGRWPLNLDVLAGYRGDEGPLGVWDYDYKNSPEDEEVAVHMAQLLDQEVDIGALDRPVREFLLSLSVEGLYRLERAFFDLTDPPVCLREALQESLTPEAFEVVMMLFTGLDPMYVVQRLHDDPSYGVTLRELSVEAIQYIRDRYKSVYFSDLVDRVIENTESKSLNEIHVDALSVLLRPEVLRCRKVLGELKRESAPEVDVLRSACSGSALKVMSFERGYDVLFPRLRIHLKLSAARMAISPSTFSELILSLEGVDPDITGRILECFDAVDVERLQELLRANKIPQRVIEECYDLLYPERTLRHALKEMAIDLDLINETLLHLEGYCSVTVASEICDAVACSRAEELGAIIIEILNPPSQNHPNDRIPSDINWMDEMVYQIGLAYRRLTGESLIAACRSAGVPSEQLMDITNRIYGPEVCTTARELFNLIKCTKEATPIAEGTEARLSSHLESRGPKYKERLLAAYQSYWAHTPGFSSLLDDMTKLFKDSPSKRKLLALFLGSGGERKPPPSNPSGLH
jgi:hypothetical protein